MEYTCFPEVIREFTLEETENKNLEALVSNPIVFAEDSLLFNQKLIDGRAHQFREAAKLSTDYVFFDRGLPDVLAYMDYFDQPVNDAFNQICHDLSYDRVFILPPWKEIFELNEIRFESYKELEELTDHLKKRYTYFGNPPVVVPKEPVADRVQFILNSLKDTFE